MKNPDSHHWSFAPHTIPLAGLAVACFIAAIEATGQPLINSERSTNGPMPVDEVIRKSAVPPGFQLTAFAAEPYVNQPIAMATDARGRLWVAENFTYSEQAIGYNSQLRDRIVVFEDVDGDGRFDKRKVFWDQAERLTSVEVGLGGIWAICLPNLVFIPDENGDDVPDGPPKILLDGFDFRAARHTVANGLRWGPDGWLYGRQGILGTSRVGTPGTPDKDRIALNVGIWRFHPSRLVFEIVAEGTTNPWGMDWDARGEGFFINTVIGHLWHLIPGAHYRRMFGDDPNPSVYELIDQHADHVHWATNEVWTDVRKGVTDATLAAGGGHAHSGLLIYQGGQWPEAWNGKLLTINFHGRRLNIERLENNGSGFVGRAEPDAVMIADPWFRGIDLIAAPDGAVFISDWSDTGECHDHDGIHRTSGRIYKLSFGTPGSTPSTDLTTLSGEALVNLQRSPNEWLARQARRVLADKYRKGIAIQDARENLKNLARNGTNEWERLRGLWGLHLTGGCEPALLRQSLLGGEYERTWALRLWEDGASYDRAVRASFDPFVNEELESIARTEPSASVRLTLASLLQKLPAQQRLKLGRALLQHQEDNGDHNISLMLWYGLLPLAKDSPDFVELVAKGRIRRVQRLGARFLAENIDNAPERVDALVAALDSGNSPDSTLAILDGLADGLAGRRKVTAPPSWVVLDRRFSNDDDSRLRNKVRDLSALFGDGRALDQIRAVALNTTADIPQRRRALESLITARSSDLRSTCEQLLPVRDLSATAARGLSQFDDPEVADRLLAEWPRLYGHERAPVLNALVSRPAWATRLLEAVRTGRVRAADIGVAQVRQIQAYNNPQLSRELADLWGTMDPPTDDAKQQSMRRWKAHLSPEALTQSDASGGKRVFEAVCGSCHKFYGKGGDIGPDLSGAAHDSIDYWLENLLFPNAIVPAEFYQSTLTLKDGRVLTGAVRNRNLQVLTLQMVGEEVRIIRSDIETEIKTGRSLMPDGILDSLSETEVANLMGFLMRKAR